MPELDDASRELIGLLAILVLVAANGFFVAAEFSLVAVRRSRVKELVRSGNNAARALLPALDNLDANLAATQLGITISSLALGWIGEPALAHLILPLLEGLPGNLPTAGSHALAVTFAFLVITALHIVVGELAPKSLALQRSEATALRIIRPLSLFLFLFRPAIGALNGLGNLVIRLCGLQPGSGEESLHSADELKLLVAESQEAGLLHLAQRELVERVLNMADRRVSDIMTPRVEIDWIDANDTAEQILQTLRDSRHEALLVSRGNIDEPIGMVLKRDMLDRVLQGKPLDPLAMIRDPLVVHETTSIFQVLGQFKAAPVRLAIIVDEYGVLLGIVTQTDLLEVVAGDLPESIEDAPSIVERKDGSLLIDGALAAHDAYAKLGLRKWPNGGGFHTIAGFALERLGHLPEAGEVFQYENWTFEIIDMDGRRIDKLLARQEPEQL